MKKSNRELMFAPTNLHLQRMSVFDTALKTSKCYFYITITRVFSLLGLFYVAESRKMV